MPQAETMPLHDTPSPTEAAVSRRALLTAGAGLAAQLNLTADQQASIKSILSNARAQAKAAQAAGTTTDMTVLGNPGDPNYATALQTAKTHASTRLQNESELQGQIYNVLTAQQKAQLPTVLASIKAQAAQRRADWQQKHSSGSSSSG